MKFKHTLINTLQLLLLAAFIIIVIYTAENFTFLNVVGYSFVLVAITSMKVWLKNYVTRDLNNNQTEEERINDKILRLLRYSFVEGDEVLQYQHLTPRERAIVSPSEYKIILQRVLDKNPLV